MMNIMSTDYKMVKIRDYTKVGETMPAKIDYSYWKSDEGIGVIGQWKKNGVTNKEICEKIGINESTLYEWQKTIPSLAENLKYTREIANTTLENKAFEMAMAGNTMMMMFLLKNRMSDKYRDRQELSVESTKEAISEIKNLSETLGTE